MTQRQTPKFNFQGASGVHFLNKPCIVVRALLTVGTGESKGCYFEREIPLNSNNFLNLKNHD